MVAASMQQDAQGVWQWRGDLNERQRQCLLLRGVMPISVGDETAAAIEPAVALEYAIRYVSGGGGQHGWGGGCVQRGCGGESGWVGESGRCHGSVHLLPQEKRKQGPLW